MQTYTLKVVDLKRETEDTITVCFKQPALKKISYQAGQYLTLIFRINGRRYIRPYSFSSTPKVDALLEVTVKRVPNGIVSNHINDVVKIGDSIEVMPPMGDFVFPKEFECNSVFLWGAGSGITPLFSIAKHILNFEPHVKVFLVYGNRKQESIIFAASISKLYEEFQHQIEVWHFQTELTVDEMLPNVIQGRIDADKVLENIAQKSLQQSVHFICGPVGLKSSVKESLIKRQVPSQHIFSEDFELVKNPADFENINTQIVNLNYNGLPYTVEVVKGKSILEAALDANIELPYSCQTGNCSSCKAVLKNGDARMIGLTKEREDLSEKEYLLCCTYPLTENIIIEL